MRNCYSWVLFVTFLFIQIISIAQESKDSIKLWTIYPGYVITKSDDTIHGHLLLKNKISNQGKVFFFDSPSADEPSEKYKPKEIKAYKVADRCYQTMKYSPEYTTMIYSFMLKVVDGPVKLYKSYYDKKQRIKFDENDIWNSKIDISLNEDELQEQCFGSRDGKKLEEFSSFKYVLNFKKNMSRYLSDCPVISKKIANEEPGYKYADLEKIIREYNELVLKNK